MGYVLGFLLVLVLIVLFLICIGLALAIGAIVGVFVAYVRAAITYVSSIVREVDNRGARIFMTTVSVIAIALPALFIVACIVAIILSM